MLWHPWLLVWELTKSQVKISRARGAPRAYAPVTAPASISSAAANRTHSRRARSSAVSPPPSGYLMTLA
jgi:hypothetical protein